MSRFLSTFFLLHVLLITVVSAQTPEPFIPYSGDWKVVQVQELNNCPDQFLPEDRWTVTDGSIHLLNFTTLEGVPYQLHQIVAQEEMTEAPDFFTITIGDYNQYEIYPNIMTQPYTYRYAVLDEETIIMEYTQTLALSVCELVISYNISHLGTTATTPQTPPQTQDQPSSTTQTADLSGWDIVGDSQRTLTLDDPNEPAGAICSANLSSGEKGYFMADDAFVDKVRFGYGQSLNYDLKLVNLGAGTYFDAPDIILVIGNGGYELNYYFDHAINGTHPTTDWQTYQVILDENAGWIEPEGVFDISTPALFQEILEFTAQVWIRGEYLSDTNQACVANVSVGDLDNAETDPVQLLNGLYELTLFELTDNCPVLFPVGTIQQLQLSFSVSDDFAWFYIWTEGGEQPAVFYSYDHPNFYQLENPDAGHIEFVNETEFILQHNLSQTCVTRYDGRWIGN